MAGLRRKRIFCLALAGAMMLSAVGCGSTSDGGADAAETFQQEVSGESAAEEAQAQESADIGVPEIDGLTFTSEMELQYAQGFAVYDYAEGYTVIRVDDGTDYLLVPEGAAVPENLSDDYTILQKPLDTVYMAATAVMSLVDTVDALDCVRFSGTEADGWYIDNAKSAMEAGDILFAGKYSEPDYELMLAEGCDLAVESTMILHSPDVKEKLEELGIPVFVDRSSYESHPLGRTEWMKLYGVLFDKRDEAQAAFAEQSSYVEELADFENTGKTVAFFYMNDNGLVVTRKSSDYLPKMIELAGGKYIFEELGDTENATSGVNMTMEEFYATAKDADYIIYNATIDRPVNSVDELLEKSELFADFKAVQEGNVWCTGKYLYQATDELGGMIGDIHTMLTDPDAEQMTFLTKLH